MNTPTGCMKQSYVSKADALNALNRVRQRKRQGRAKKSDHGPIRVYQCAVCGLWHLTSRPHLTTGRRRP